jgi:AraC family transcriptional regulator
MAILGEPVMNTSISRVTPFVAGSRAPALGLNAADAPSFERYDENFDPTSGNGGLEIWVPVRD